ncbi:similar to Saccharomyces cerevisiae YJL140W RPB4 RNA polymerase II subunit B32 [Geotrichum candidum]|uniref:Similar to Saccharomyces cerevisiae YJL140W RPB4 RNA polymerase II subunit B32 n=1 Tax=Geotrichum candidum TaxID=1173061 RepID=A0A0J9XKL9_GEOCN|nr:similar to Saccharomyces cerevisiae YJL140W RPB4 RNA polymerase II subunit B32 [Geotrichum candidum]
MNISTSTIAQSRRKPTQNIIDDEDASELRLGPEFSIHQISHDNVETPLITLNLSETRLLINAALKERRRQENGGDLGDADGNDNDEDEDFSNSNEVLRKTQEYLSIFARFRDEQTVSAVENILRTPENANLHPFEIAQLGSLACEEAEEAKTLIPSIGDKKSDQELQVLLDQLRQFG